jgi:hypothetical protein
MWNTRLGETLHNYFKFEISNRRKGDPGIFFYTQGTVETSDDRFHVNIAPQIPPPIKKYIPASMSKFFPFGGLVLSILTPKTKRMIAGI